MEFFQMEFFQSKIEITVCYYTFLFSWDQAGFKNGIEST
jgi:hypothetical protein